MFQQYFLPYQALRLVNLALLEDVHRQGGFALTEAAQDVGDHVLEIFFAVVEINCTFFFLFHCFL